MIKKLFISAILLCAILPTLGILSKAEVFAQTVDTVWVRRYNGPAGNNHDEAHGIAVDDSGYVFVTGRSVGSGTSYDYVTIKYYPNGDTIWLRRYNGPGNWYDVAYAIALDNSSNVYVTGYGDQDPGSAVKEDYITIKYDQNGNQLWVRTYDGPPGGADHAMAMVLDDYGNVYVTGMSAGSGAGFDYATVKYDPSGNQLWARRYNGTGNGDDYAASLSLDGSGNVYVTGFSTGSGANRDYTTIKYDTYGNELWVRKYNGPGNGEDAAIAMSIDNSDNIYVTGYSAGSGTANDFATIKYFPGGDTAWVRRYNGPANSSDYAYAIAIDGSGYIYVTGSSTGSGTSYDYATVKYDSSGNELWVRRYNGPENGYDWPYAIAADASGNVYVTGIKNYVYDPLAGDYATVKYNPDGDQLWVRTYNGSGNSEDLPRAIAIDRFYNVYITGRSIGSGSYYDCATIKYYQNYAPTVIAPDSSKFLCGADTIRFTVLANDLNGDDTLNLSGPGIPAPIRRLSPLSAEAKIFVPSAGTYNYVYTVTDSRNATDVDTATYSITINTAPASFSLISPLDSALVPYVITFDWATAPDPDPSDQVKYDLYVSTSPSFQVDSTIISDSLLFTEYTDTLARGTYYWKARAYDNCIGRWSSQTWVLFSAICGDVNGDGVIDVGDVLFLINYLFKNGTAPNPLLSGDANGDDAVDVGDVLYLINYLFKGGSPPSC